MEQLAVMVVISLVIFLLIREIVCWYFKINERRDLLWEIHKELIKSNNASMIKVDMSSKHD